MSVTETGGGGEEWLDRQLEAIAPPVISEGGQAFAELSVPLGLAYEDYMQQPETALTNLVGADLLLAVEGGAAMTHWRATHVYGGKLAVHETYEGRHIARWLVGGAVYVPPTNADMLTPQETAVLAQAAWDNKTVTGITTKEREMPAMIAPGIVCLNAMLSLKRLYTVNELRAPASIAKLVNEPAAGYAVALSNGSEKMPSVYFMDDEACLTTPVTALGRLVQNKFFSVF